MWRDLFVVAYKCVCVCVCAFVCSMPTNVGECVSVWEQAPINFCLLEKNPLKDEGKICVGIHICLVIRIARIRLISFYRTGVLHWYWTSAVPKSQKYTSKVTLIYINIIPKTLEVLKGTNKLLSRQTAAGTRPSLSYFNNTASTYCLSSHYRISIMTLTE